MNIYLDTVGCRLNQSEIETFARQFHLAGHTLVDSPARADLVVVNTCAVTTQAASDSRQKLRQANRLGVRQIIATGCWATISPQDAASLPGVNRVVSNLDKDHLVADLLQVPRESFDLEFVERQPVPGARLRTRAFIKAQDGCDNRCTFCITTIARGSSRSRPFSHIIADVQAAILGGVQEVVLTGVHLGSYGYELDLPQKLSDLVRAILAKTAISRLRLSSLEPWDLSAEFFTLWENPRLCPHLHLPLQSGSTATLRRMARKITPQSFAELVIAARKAVPGIAVTTDIIAGFPGETESEFEESLAFVRQMDFSDGHVFTYSARPGTAAARMPDQVPHPLRKERNARLRAALSESAARYRQQFVGRELSVLWESLIARSADSWELSGLSGNYLRISAHSPDHCWNQINPVRLTEHTAEGLYGVIVP